MRCNQLLIRQRNLNVIFGRCSLINQSPQRLQQHELQQLRYSSTLQSSRFIGESKLRSRNETNIQGQQWSINIHVPSIQRCNLSSSSSSSTPPPPTGGSYIPPTSSFFDPKTNEPAGLRAVLDSLKRMEDQITNIENDVESIKNVVKKIRESNGLTERRIDKVEDYADTMQQDLYLTMDMIRLLTETFAPMKDGNYSTPDGKYFKNTTTPTNPNITAAAEAAAAAAAKKMTNSHDNSNDIPRKKEIKPSKDE